MFRLFGEYDRMWYNSLSLRFDVERIFELKIYYLRMFFLIVQVIAKKSQMIVLVALILVDCPLLIFERNANILDFTGPSHIGD